MTPNELKTYQEAGEISQKVKAFARTIIKPGMPLIEIAEKIEAEIEKHDAEPAFPVNLSIDHVAAHAHPLPDDETKAKGLLKVDIGIHKNGYIADSAFSLDLTDDNRHKALIEATESALQSAIDLLPENPTLNDIGETIQTTITNKGFSPIVNLAGHGLEQYEIHAHLTIPNHANGSPITLKPGAYAIEPFGTTGEGTVRDGQQGHIYQLTDPKNPRSTKAREILEYIIEKKKTLPFSLREIHKKFGPMSRLALRELEQNGSLHHFAQLVETSHKPVAQAEHTIVKTKDNEIIVTTREE